MSEIDHFMQALEENAETGLHDAVERLKVALEENDQVFISALHSLSIDGGLLDISQVFTLPPHLGNESGHMVSTHLWDDIYDSRELREELMNAAALDGYPPLAGFIIKAYLGWSAI